MSAFGVLWSKPKRIKLLGKRKKEKASNFCPQPLYTPNYFEQKTWTFTVVWSSYMYM